MSLNGMAKISAAENPISFAKRLANNLRVPGLQFVFIDQAKIPRL